MTINVRTISAPSTSSGFASDRKVVIGNSSPGSSTSNQSNGRMDIFGCRDEISTTRRTSSGTRNKELNGYEDTYYRKD